MYQFPDRAQPPKLRHLVLGISSLWLLTSCTNSVKSYSVQLREEQHTNSPAASQTQSLEKVSNEAPFVYKLSEPAGSTTPIFATSLKTCGVKKDPNSLSLARQLFSGLMDIRVDNRERLTLAALSTPIRSARGFLDGQEVFLKSVTLPDADCIVDFVAWSKDQQRLSDRSSTIMELLYNSTILPK